MRDRHAPAFSTPILAPGRAPLDRVITFEPESPWQVGQYVTFRDGDRCSVHVVESIEQSEDGNEEQYTLVSQRVWELRCAGVRPWIELDP